MNQVNLKMFKLLIGTKITLILNGVSPTTTVVHLSLATSSKSRKNSERSGLKVSKYPEINFPEPYQD